MKKPNDITNPKADKGVDPGTPVMESDAELTPKQEAKAANKLPKAEQLEHFEEDLEQRDSGNQPA